jgi:hypothetical protein
VIEPQGCKLDGQETWPGVCRAAGLKIPDVIRLVYLSSYTPKLQPAETLWVLVDKPTVNKHIAS